MTLTTSAADLVTTRMGADEVWRKATIRRIDFDGDKRDIDAMRAVFALH
ncbi:hypothetical protein [Mycobacterium sp.]|nr:hypothetical protein [Mycobacterium sp.]